MVKICHMTSAHGEEDVRVFQKECISLARAGYEVYLVERGESYEKQGVHIVGVGELPISRRKRMTKGAKRVYETALKLNADIYHFHDPELLPWGLKLKKHGKHVVFDSHENYSQQMKSKPYLPGWVSCILAAFYQRYERFAVRRMDAVVYPCTFQGELLYQDVCPRVVLLDNVARLDKIYDQYQERKPPLSGPMCLFGSLSSSRCIIEIIKAAIKAEMPLLLAGAFTSEEYQEECLSLLEGHENIRWLGQLAHSEVISLLQKMSVGLCPEKNILQYNTTDNLATKSYEYMAMGLPVIVSDYPFSRKMMDEYSYGVLVDPDDVDSIAEAMRYLCDHPDKAWQMGQNGRRAIKERFNWDMEQEKLFALYEDILKNDERV
ncbi:glycosyltransferase family 4 protein [Oscillospiraceae bacterium 50-60]